MPRRDGTEHDRNRIIKVLKYLHFEPRVYDDLSYYEILDTLDAFVEENHTDEDCLIIVVMSHGNSGILYARDHQYPVDLLWNKITGDKCPTLAGKPKLIFIQACRGDEVDAGVQLASRTGDQVDTVAKNSAAYTIPANADILVMYSTFAGHTSFRIPQVGSWFIQSLCTELEEKAKSHSLLDILTFTTRRVAVDYVSRMSDPRTDKRKQIPSIVSHLTRILHFGESNKILI
uniref:Putative caspase domain protein n=1 Tax=Xenopsylla cheopis TaxID=163159 RepID=A0A6M2DRV0_XENCH